MRIQAGVIHAQLPEKGTFQILELSKGFKPLSTWKSIYQHIQSYFSSYPLIVIDVFSKGLELKSASSAVEITSNSQVKKICPILLSLIGSIVSFSFRTARKQLSSLAKICTHLFLQYV